MTIAILADSEDVCAHLQSALPTTIVEKVLSCVFSGIPDFIADLRLAEPNAVLVSIPSGAPDGALTAIETLRASLPGAKVIASGDSTDARLIVDAMRAGASDFIGALPDTAQLAKALGNSALRVGARGKIFSFVNAKGGSGSTTIAVNVALALKSFSDRVMLVDLAVPGNAALHLNCRPAYSMKDVAENLHRLDSTLLDSLLVKHESGLHVIAGTDEPLEAINPEDFGRLADILTGAYEYVVVDVSSHLDTLTRRLCEYSDEVFLVAQADLASMWNAQRVRKYVSWKMNPDKVRLVLNRYRPVTGVAESEYEKASTCKLAWKVPNQFLTVSNAIMHGTPVARNTSGELKEHFQSFARKIAGKPEPVRTLPQETRSARSILERVSALKTLGSIALKAPDPA